MDSISGATDKDIKSLSIEPSSPAMMPQKPPFAIEALSPMLNIAADAAEKKKEKIELNLPPMNLPSIDMDMEDSTDTSAEANMNNKSRSSVPAALEVLSRDISPFEELEVESGSIATIPKPAPPMNIPQIAQPPPSMALPPSVMADLPDVSGPTCVPCPPRMPTPSSTSNSLSETIAPLAESAAANGSVVLPATGYVPLTSTGRLICTLEEWNARPQMTIDPVTHEMRFRQLRMQCTHCPEAFTKTHDLYAHIRTHQHHTKCPHCSKNLTCMATFVYHVRTHTGEKPYYCPVDGCDFTNSVKYNLKVHLACIRHGGKANLAKFAKVLDLDVCDKSIKKRKDNSVHELGSRRSKKRRKLNNGAHEQSAKMSAEMNVMGSMNMSAMAGMNMAALGGVGAIPGMGYGSYYNQSQLQQEEYDQYAAQLLYSLSSMNGGAYDPNISALPPAMGPYDPTLPPVKDETGAAVVGAGVGLKPEQMQMYDPAMMAAYQNLMPAMPMMGALPPQMPMDNNPAQPMAMDQDGQAQDADVAPAAPEAPVVPTEAVQSQEKEQQEQKDGDVADAAPAIAENATDEAIEASDVKGEQGAMPNQMEALQQMQGLPPVAYDLQQMMAGGGLPAAYPPATGDYAQQLQAMQGMQMPGYYYSMAAMAGGGYYMNYDQQALVGMGMQGLYGMPQGMGLPMPMDLSANADADCHNKKIECPPLPIEEDDEEENQ